MSFAASAHHPDAGTGETKATLRRRKSSSRTSVVAALIGDLLVAASKIVAALWTGSAAMMGEAIHSVIDSTNEILLLYGIHRSKLKADAAHPFGYGREIYFWSFVVSLLIFALGAGFAIFVGVGRTLTPVPIESPVVSYSGGPMAWQWMDRSSTRLPEARHHPTVRRPSTAESVS